MNVLLGVEHAESITYRRFLGRLGVEAKLRGHAPKSR